MSDILKAVAQAFSIIGLKVRNPQTIVDNLKVKGIDLSDAGGFLSARQGSTEFNVGELLQGYFKQYPADFVGHSGEVKYRSDVLDTKAKVKYINDHGYAAWAALPANPQSPYAQVVTPAIPSTKMTRKDWLSLTISERSAAIASWGKDAVKTVGEIMNRRR